MSFNRSIFDFLNDWKISKYRKPLVLRGARQVGKTTAIKEFGKSFDNFIYLNLETEADKSTFENDLSVQDITQKMFIEQGRTMQGETLIFIDEIQNSPRAVQLMRYFYELMPELYIISAGSLLEIMMDNHKISFPVGRVEYCYMYPMSFREYLQAAGESESLKLFETVPLPRWASDHLFKLFHRYSLIGGMPEVVARYLEDEDVSALKPVYEALLTAYKDDVGKYAKNQTELNIIRFVIENAAFEAVKRITFEKFANSNYRSREIGNAIRKLERAMLMYLRYPTTHTEPPLMTDLKKKPKLQFFDTGLLNYAAGLQAEYFEHKNLHSFYSGLLAEHIVIQEVMATDRISLNKPAFWVRELRQSNAETDLLIPYKNRIIPVEVKAGKTGTLRSLHSYLDTSNLDTSNLDTSKKELAVRLYAGDLSINETATPQGTPYTLLNLPYFLAAKIPDYIEWLDGL